uniref:ANK_REP_REGION domain-containing protein n=1 Tax=Globodera pallida TaxID=36090 RepID=A0A183BMM4_GLOPA
MNEEAREFVLQAIAYDNAELLEELLAERPSLANDHDGREGRTPLHHAAAGGHTKCAEILLRSGADVDAVAGLQDTVKTPLGLASSLGHCGVVELLVTSGSDLFYVDSDGHSALQLAQINGNHDVATLLIGTIERIHVEAEQKNKRLCAACVDGEVAAVLEILSDLGPKTIRKHILNGRSPGEQKSVLFLAAEHGRAQIVRALLTVQYHSIIFEPTGDTILHAAVASQSVATVELILNKFPFLMDAINEEKSLPIHWACRIVQTLLGAEYPDDELKFFEFRRDRENCCFANGGESACCEGYLFVCNLNAVDQEGRTP